MGKNTKEFLVALHVLNLPQVLEQAAKILTPDGAHGVLLVNNNGNVLSGNEAYPNLFDIALEVKEKFPDYLVGVNPLDLHYTKAVSEIPDKLDILWTDNGGIKEDATSAFIDQSFMGALYRLKPSYYGGVAFKYLAQPRHLRQSCEVAASNFGAVITSGDATGSAPAVEKIRTIREYIGPNKRLGIASGASIKNIDLFLPHADIFIVATSLCENFGNGDDFYRYDPDKVQGFRAKLEHWESQQKQ